MTTLASNTLALGPDFISADSLAKAGLAVVLLIIFAESGLLVGFFLPGDSLLFTLGLLISRDEVSTPLWLAAALVGLAAIAGDQVGYLFGRKVGPSLFRRPDSRLFKQEYVEQAHEFFEKYGPRSIVLARFVPIVRTFTPVIAGVSRMNYRTFVTFNVVGGLLWACGVTILGYFLGKIDFIRENVEAMLVLIVLISVVPIAVEFLRARRRGAAGGAAGAGAAAPVSGGSGSPSGSGSGFPGRAAPGGTGGTGGPGAPGRAAPATAPRRPAAAEQNTGEWLLDEDYVPRPYVGQPPASTRHADRYAEDGYPGGDRYPENRRPENRYPEDQYASDHYAGERSGWDVPPGPRRRGGGGSRH